MFLYESNCNYNSYKFNHTYAFIPLFSFRENEKKESNLQQVGSLVNGKFFIFSVWWVTLHSKGLPNSIVFYEEIFLHVTEAVAQKCSVKMVFLESSQNS